MNLLDGIIIAVIALSAITAYYRGFLYTTFKVLSTIIAIYLSNIWHQPINSILSKTFLYDLLQKIAMSNVEGIQNLMGLSEQTRFIDNTNMLVPETVKEGLIRNNNPEIYKMLGADSFNEYIGGYIADFYLNIIAFIILLALIKAALNLIGESIRLLSKLPIIGFADRWLGLVVGIIRAFIGIWISAIVMTFLIGIPRLHGLSEQLSQSNLGMWFYENNLILDIINQLFI